PSCGAVAARYAEISLRPLRRRAARMARPARVRMRRRKPCFLARRRLLGWKVRLVTVDLLLLQLAHTPGGPIPVFARGQAVGRANNAQAYVDVQGRSIVGAACCPTRAWSECGQH